MLCYLNVNLFLFLAIMLILDGNSEVLANAQGLSVIRNLICLRYSSKSTKVANLKCKKKVLAGVTCSELPSNMRTMQT